MPDGFSIRSDGVLERFLQNAANAPEWLPKVVEFRMTWLGKDIEKRMQEAVAPNIYTGALSQSVTSDYTAAAQEVAIYPTVMRGRWDGGLILELGTRPIPNAPWAPIKAWAEAHGLPGFPVWYKIRTQGVAAHPFLQRTLDASKPDIDDAGMEIVSDAAGILVNL